MMRMLYTKIMKNIIDLHIHTVASGHAYSTIQEVARVANKQGLHVIGISDHGPKMVDGPHEYYFLNLGIVPNFIDGVRVLKGVELNILDDRGTVDLMTHHLAHLDYAIASFHPGIGPNFYSQQQHTNALLAALENPYVKILGHIDDPRVPIDFVPILKRAAALNKLIELNNSSERIRPGSLKNSVIMARLAKELGCKLIFNSDAHISNDVGNTHVTQHLIHECGLTESDYVNHDVSFLRQFIPFSDS